MLCFPRLDYLGPRYCRSSSSKSICNSFNFISIRLAFYLFSRSTRSTTLFCIRKAKYFFSLIVEGWLETSNCFQGSACIEHPSSLRHKAVFNNIVSLGPGRLRAVQKVMSGIHAWARDKSLKFFYRFGM